jgi:chemotaxis protein MotA
MNFSLPIGIILGALVVISTILKEVTNTSVFLNPIALIIVFGGTLAAVIICFPLGQFVNIAKVLWRALTGKTYTEAAKVIDEIVKLAEFRDDLSGQVSGISNLFLKESIELSLEGAISEDDLESVLIKRVETQNEKYRQDAAIFKIIGKFPPAFGLIGTTLGMIALLQSIGTAGAFQKLGPSMSTALTATFWGLVFSNLFLVPLGENLFLASQYDLTVRRIVVDGVLLLKEGKHPVVIEEYLKSHLPPQMRNKLNKISNA